MIVDVCLWRGGLDTAWTRNEHLRAGLLGLRLCMGSHMAWAAVYDPIATRRKQLLSRLSLPYPETMRVALTRGLIFFGNGIMPRASRLAQPTWPAAVLWPSLM